MSVTTILAHHFSFIISQEFPDQFVNRGRALPYLEPFLNIMLLTKCREQKTSFILHRHVRSCVINVEHLANSCTALIYALRSCCVEHRYLPHTHRNTSNIHLRCIMMASVPRLAVLP